MKIEQIDNIKLLHIIKFLSSLYFYHQIITFYFQARGLNYLQINSMWGIIVATQALFEIPTGLIGDKIGRKYSIIIALVFQFAGEVIFIFADNYLYFVCASVIGGIGFSFMSGCYEAMLYDSLKEKNREKDVQKVAGLNNSMGLAAILIGTLIGGYITKDLKLTSYIMAIVATAFFVFLSLIVSFMLSEPNVGEYKNSCNSITLLKDGIYLLKNNKSLQKLILLSLAANPFVNYLMMLYQPYFEQSHVSGILYGISLAAASFLGIFASKYAYLLEDKFGISKGILYACIFPGIFYLLMCCFSISYLAVAFVVAGLAVTHIQRPIFTDYINGHIESKNRATVLSLISILSGIYVAIAGLLIGWVADYSLQLSFLFVGIIIMIGTLSFRVGKDDVVKSVTPTK